MSYSPPDLVRLVGDLVARVAATDAQYRANYVPGLRTSPIPFFGALSEADVLTVGLNPSDKEFAPGRWSDAPNAPELTARLLAYFDAPPPEAPPHPWFNAWEYPLRAHLGASYHAGARLRVAHLDLSPRATIRAGAVPDPSLFSRMVADDLPHALGFVAAAPRARLVLLAGTVPGGGYLNAFVKRTLRHSPPPRVGALEGAVGLPPGKGAVAWHHLHVGDRVLAAYFCGSSPSDWGSPGLLGERIGRDADALRRQLG